MPPINTINPATSHVEVLGSFLTTQRFVGSQRRHHWERSAAAAHTAPPCAPQRLGPDHRDSTTLREEKSMGGSEGRKMSKDRSSTTQITGKISSKEVDKNRDETDDDDDAGIGHEWSVFVLVHNTPISSLSMCCVSLECFAVSGFGQDPYCKD